MVHAGGRASPAEATESVDAVKALMEAMIEMARAKESLKASDSCPSPTLGLGSCRPDERTRRRAMMKVKLDTEAASRAIADGSMPALMQDTLGRLQPEAAYFGPEDGIRTAFIVFDLKDPSELPPITEPLFSNLKATVEMFPVMDRDDLQKGCSSSARAGSRPSSARLPPRSGRPDLNRRPSGPQPDALPGCATPRSGRRESNPSLRAWKALVQPLHHARVCVRF